MKTIYLASIHGIDNSGGLERVNQYIYEILSKKYSVKVISGRIPDFKHGNWLLQSVYISLKLFFKINKIVIGNSWHSFLYPCDYSIHHGTLKGIMIHTNDVSLYKKRISMMEKISSFTAKKVIAVGENVKDELIEFYHVNKKKIIVLNNFVDDTIFYPKYNCRKNNKIIILFSGRLEERKGLNFLLVLSKFIEKSDEFELHIATNSENNKNLFENNKNVKIYTALSPSKMCDFYNEGDIFYFPTQYEGFSMATLESLSCGIPVIGSEWAIGREIRDYDFARIVTIKNTKELLSSIVDCVNKYRDKKEEIHNQIKIRFGKKQYERRLLNLIESLLYKDKGQK